MLLCIVALITFRVNMAHPESEWQPQSNYVTVIMRILVLGSFALLGFGDLLFAVHNFDEKCEKTCYDCKFFDPYCIDAPELNITNITDTDYESDVDMLVPSLWVGISGVLMIAISVMSISLVVMESLNKNSHLFRFAPAVIGFFLFVFFFCEMMVHIFAVPLSIVGFGGCKCQELHWVFQWIIILNILLFSFGTYTLIFIGLVLVLFFLFLLVAPTVIFVYCLKECWKSCATTHTVEVELKEIEPDP
jgi:hypothetical protein